MNDKSDSSDKPEKKERVMHTRIPESLDIQLRHKAKGLGVSVSNLVRNVLSHTFDLVDDIVSDSADIARQAKGELDRVTDDSSNSTASPLGVESGESKEPNIVGWQSLVLNLNAICHACNEIMPKGTNAAVGITANPSKDSTQPTPFICTKCLKDLSHE